MELGDTMDDVVLRSATGLIPDHTVTICETTQPLGNTIVAVIGFSCADIRGALGLAMPPRIAKALHPTTLAGEEPDDFAVHDWVAEMANQFLGRLKYELMKHGVTVWLTTPLVLRGLNVEASGTVRLRRLQFEGEHGIFASWADLEPLQGFELNVDQDASADAAGAGDVLIF